MQMLVFGMSAGRLQSTHLISETCLSFAAVVRLR